MGVLAAVVVPNVGKFLGRGDTEAANTELQAGQSAVFSMMVDNGVSSLPPPVPDTPPPNSMIAFPDAVVVASKKDRLGN